MEKDIRILETILNEMPEGFKIRGIADRNIKKGTAILIFHEDDIPKEEPRKKINNNNSKF